VLTGGQAPPSFQPPVTFVTTSSTAMSTSQPVKVEPDLITRYNLQSRISSKGKEKEVEAPAPTWSSSKEDRQKMLQRRRDEMVLAARRKMQEKDAEGPPLSSSGDP
jgi:coupling of ubiquitin conjugation to ER degradation protein 1